MSEKVRIKITPEDRMVEIPIGSKHYENRVEVDLIVTTQTLASNEDDSAMLAEEVLMHLIETMKAKLQKENYGVAITNYGIMVQDTEIAEEEDDDEA